MTDETTFDKFEERLLATQEGRGFLETFEAKVRADLLRSFEAFAATERDKLASQKSAEDPLDLAQVVRNIFAQINDTRAQLESLTNMAMERSGQSFNGVGDELEAITFDTERATTTIMNGIDEIEALVGRMRADGIEAPQLKAILRLCTDVTVACSFQDINGQRVQKVVEVIESIDGQLSKIETQLGGQTSPRSPQHARSREQQRADGLLDGPAHPEVSVGQDEIDRLFEAGEQAPFSPEEA
ncbi:protein phosphatase CheZ [Salipiger sp. PrR003]|uniref:protein phosphatase CheZ n=1 Tax=Salipiger sp. PrR003 TaxID=2706776 RepID=UPI0013D984C6|nr:protein phosphatase CheZ [Salipiger sp. PrR003]NDV52820.1 hypothetical protein [Salipiger sp. PrR003]